MVTFKLKAESSEVKNIKDTLQSLIYCDSTEMIKSTSKL